MRSVFFLVLLVAIISMAMAGTHHYVKREEITITATTVVEEVFLMLQQVLPTEFSDNGRLRGRNSDTIIHINMSKF
ncbi:hypothetical protein CEXT_13711 [Caerostris extrusa]|uniref:Uncharacterized protein n=1 Tax=Caerostris extrusa TaxID=172846 RepID=A0AAV4Y3C5_CAEEX|nr:hypothetical protein CEXT_13711 [Caerostris extrusa]